MGRGVRLVKRSNEDKFICCCRFVKLPVLGLPNFPEFGEVCESCIGDAVSALLLWFLLNC